MAAWEREYRKSISEVLPLITCREQNAETGKERDDNPEDARLRASRMRAQW
jgi:hypothetical protein